MSDTMGLDEKLTHSIAEGLQDADAIADLGDAEGSIITDTEQMDTYTAENDGAAQDGFTKSQGESETDNVADVSLNEAQLDESAMQDDNNNEARHIKGSGADSGADEYGFADDVDIDAEEDEEEDYDKESSDAIDVDESGDEHSLADDDSETEKVKKDEREYSLNDEEKDIIGEIGNICMGTSATTLSNMLGKKVSITTPKVTISHDAKELGYYKKPFLAVEVSYTEGVSGYNILLMKEPDVKVITDILMGGVGDIDEEADIDELHFSAISEVMNQMVGSASTSLSNLLMRQVNISPPQVKRIVLEDDDLSTLICHNDIIIKTAFQMQIEDVLNSELMQLLSYDFGKELAAEMKDSSNPDIVKVVDKAEVESEKIEKPVKTEETEPKEQIETVQETQSERSNPERQMPFAHEQILASATEQVMAIRKRAIEAQQEQHTQNRVGVKSMTYNSFDDFNGALEPAGDNIGLILDVPLQVTVELGKCRKSIKDILGLTTGSVIVLDRLAGEMVDIMVNGKLFARGEVVVIDDSYGVRVTDIIALPQTLA